VSGKHPRAENGCQCAVREGKRRGTRKAKGTGVTYNSGENLRHKQRHDILGGKEQSSPGNDQDQASDDRIAIAKTLRDEAVYQKTDELSNVGTLEMVSIIPWLASGRSGSRP
jgi:hypothetical protein